MGKELPKKDSTGNNANYLKYLTKLNKGIFTFELVYETQITKLIERFPNKEIVD